MNSVGLVQPNVLAEAVILHMFAQIQKRLGQLFMSTALNAGTIYTKIRCKTVCHRHAESWRIFL